MRLRPLLPTDLGGDAVYKCVPKNCSFYLLIFLNEQLINYRVPVSVENFMFKFSADNKMTQCVVLTFDLSITQCSELK